MSKKNFNEDSVLAAMGINTEPEAPLEAAPKAPAKAAAQPAKKSKGRPVEDREKRTKHLQILLTPSDYNKLYAAYKKSSERSLNDYINKLFEKYAK